jgi:NADH-quinone oxidoreductase subunit E
MPALSPELKKKIEEVLPKYPNKQAATLPALHLVHDAHRAVSHEAIKEIASILELRPAEVYDTMSFYGFFREADNPLGKNRVWVCRSLSCALRGGEELLAGLCDKWSMHPGETSPDGRISLEYAECLGVCEGAPCVLVNEDCHPNQTVDSVAKLVSK